jgi:cytochrome c biogenesis protein CcmG/thiol:disulfide interchange protein DsbE
MAEQEFYSGKILYPVTLALLVLSLLFGFAILPRLFSAPEGALVGKPAPDFTARVVANSDKPSLSLHDVVGSAVVLDFWATWCGPCQAEAPIVNKVAQRFADRGLVVVGVDTSDPTGHPGPWARSHGLSYPIVADETNEVAEHYGVTNLPTLIVVSRTGKVLAVREGMTGDAELEELVKQAL